MRSHNYRIEIRYSSPPDVSQRYWNDVVESDSKNEAKAYARKVLKQIKGQRIKIHSVEIKSQLD